MVRTLMLDADGAKGLINRSEFFAIYSNHQEENAIVAASDKGGGAYYLNERRKLGLGIKCMNGFDFIRAQGFKF